LIEAQIKEIFNAVEIYGDNYNEISVMITACKTLDELRETWARLSQGGKLQVLNKREQRNAVSIKDILKQRINGVNQ
jgi:hypothetical protein